MGCAPAAHARARAALAGAAYVAPGGIVVHRGDTLYSLARRHRVGVAELAAANGLARPEALRAGMRLVLPGAAGVHAARLERPAPRLAPSPTQRGSGLLAWPAPGPITSAFGVRHGRPHDGIDIGAPRGTRVAAAAAGDVVYAARHGGYGNLVILKHAGNLITVYAHHDANLVRPGERVACGQTIARVGSSGRASGPHLHFEVRHGSRPANPLGYLQAR